MQQGEEVPRYFADSKLTDSTPPHPFIKLSLPEGRCGYIIVIDSNYGWNVNYWILLLIRYSYNTKMKTKNKLHCKLHICVQCLEMIVYPKKICGCGCNYL